MTATEPRTGATIAIGDRIVITPDITVRVTSVDHNDGHIYLFEVDEWMVSLAIGKVQVVDVIPGHVVAVEDPVVRIERELQELSREPPGTLRNRALVELAARIEAYGKDLVKRTEPGDPERLHLAELGRALEALFP